MRRYQQHHYQQNYHHHQHYNRRFHPRNPMQYDQISSYRHQQPPQQHQLEYSYRQQQPYRHHQPYNPNATVPPPSMRTNSYNRFCQPPYNGHRKFLVSNRSEACDSPVFNSQPGLYFSEPATYTTASPHSSTPPTFAMNSRTPRGPHGPPPQQSASATATPPPGATGRNPVMDRIRMGNVINQGDRHPQPIWSYGTTHYFPQPIMTPHNMALPPPYSVRYPMPIYQGQGAGGPSPGPTGGGMPSTGTPPSTPLQGQGQESTPNLHQQRGQHHHQHQLHQQPQSHLQQKTTMQTIAQSQQKFQKVSAIAQPGGLTLTASSTSINRKQAVHHSNVMQGSGGPMVATQQQMQSSRETNQINIHIGFNNQAKETITQVEFTNYSEESMTRNSYGNSAEPTRGRYVSKFVPSPSATSFYPSGMAYNSANSRGGSNFNPTATQEENSPRSYDSSNSNSPRDEGSAVVARMDVASNRQPALGSITGIGGNSGGGRTIINSSSNGFYASSSARVAVGAGGDASTVCGGAVGGIETPGGGDKFVLTQAKFNELTRLALRGSEIAERLAYLHRSRPCFKKIDSLCARMKQDLIRPDGVLPNINSQGIAWAVKDLIFVFTRIVNAWIIVKGYVYNTPEGLNKVKSALSADFASSFGAWQDTTVVFLENLIKSFVNLDNLVHAQKSTYQKSDGTSKPTLLEESFGYLNIASNDNVASEEMLSNNYNYTMVEDSENTQREATMNGTYFKTGTYNPIKKEALLMAELKQQQMEKQKQKLLSQKMPPTDDRSDDDTNARPDSGLNSNRSTMSSSSSMSTSSSLSADGATGGNMQCKYENPTMSYDPYFDDYWPSDLDAETNTDEIGSDTDSALGGHVDDDSTSADATNAGDRESSPSQDGRDKVPKYEEKIPPPHWLNSGFRVLEPNLSEFSDYYDPTEPFRPLGEDVVDKLNIMMNRLMEMPDAEMFFKQMFMRNYFPDFMAKHQQEFMDVRSIILKCQIGVYHHLFQIVHDLKMITFVGRKYLQTNKDMNFYTALNVFEVALKKVLTDPPFDNYHFDHITGDPDEMLYIT